MDKYLEKIEEYVSATIDGMQDDLDAGFAFADVWTDHWADLESTLEMILKEHVYNNTIERD